ncbi:MAG: cysteine protease [Helicobacteraceae bacterium CG2_30_36_10]|nr:MAG: cysteine protease [Helicobacteraceae bacterium CG2_30_36_10]
MWLHISCDLTFEITVPTPFIFMLRPRSGANQWIASQEYKIVPSVPVLEFTDIYGNLCQRLIAPPGTFAIYTSAEVQTTEYIDEAPGAHFVEIQNLPDSVLMYLLPSRYCEADLFTQMAAEITANELLGYNQVRAITLWLRETIRFEPQNSDALLSAVEVNVRGFGVCRDFAHLGIAMCRSLSIPARMVVGYLHDLEPMDLHAWFEAYVGDRWYSFDATQAEMRGGYVAVGYGRDAADVAIYNQFGPALYSTSQNINVKKIEDNATSDLG